VAPLSPIITGLRKADAIQSEPYATYAHVFREEAFSCDRWLIVGYGGRDPHISDMLLQAREHWLRSGREHRVLIVGHFPFLSNGFAGGIDLASVVYQPEGFEWWNGVFSLLWFFEDAGRLTIIRPGAVNRVGNGVAITLDGVQWAMSSGLPAVKEFFGI
jgi:hypothetical protein